MRPFFGIIQFDFALLPIIIVELCQSENENLSEMCYFVAVESGFQDSPGWSHSKLVENQQHISPVSEKHKIQIQGVPKNALSECCWSNSALAQSQVAGIP